MNNRVRRASFSLCERLLAPDTGFLSDFSIHLHPVLRLSVNIRPKWLHKSSASAEPPAGWNYKLTCYMPKVKTNSSAKKRFKVTGTGKITHQKSFKRHILTKKSTKRKRHMGHDGVVHKSNLDFVKRLLRLK